MIITTAVPAAIAPRQADPLGQLISQGIVLGNSILSEILSTTSTVSIGASTTSDSFLTPSSPSTSSTTNPALPSSTIGFPTYATSSPAILLRTSANPSISAASPSIKSSIQSFSSSIPDQLSQHLAATSTSGSPPGTALLASSSSFATVTPTQPVAYQSSSNNHTNKPLVVALAVVIGIFALLLLVGTIWFLRRKTRKNKEAARRRDEKIHPVKDYDDGLHATSDWKCAQIPQMPAASAVRSSSMRTGRYEPLSPISPVSSQNPFLSPLEAHPIQRHDDSYLSRQDSQMETLLGSPSRPVEGPSEMPAEVEGDAGHTLMAHGAPKLSRAIWPSRTESLKFDFGFRPKPAGSIRDSANFTVPRRPVAA